MTMKAPIIYAKLTNKRLILAPFTNCILLENEYLNPLFSNKHIGSIKKKKIGRINIGTIKNTDKENTM